MAVASSNGKSIDAGFGRANEFMIYTLNEDGFKLIERREWHSPEVTEEDIVYERCCHKKKSGCSGGISSAALTKVNLLSDCTAVCCLEMGTKVQKEFEKRTISVFETEGDINNILEKIHSYYIRIKAF